MVETEINEWLWLLKTGKGDFFITVIGKWTQEEAAGKVREAFDRVQISIIEMIQRKRATGPDDAMCTLFDPEVPEAPLGLSFWAGRRLWEACGRGTEYDERMRLKKEIDDNGNQNNTERYDRHHGEGQGRP